MVQDPSQVRSAGGGDKIMGYHVCLNLHLLLRSHRTDGISTYCMLQVDDSTSSSGLCFVATASEQKTLPNLRVTDTLSLKDLFYLCSTSMTEERRR